MGNEMFSRTKELTW